MDVIFLKDIFRILGVSIGLAGGILSSKSWHEDYYSLCIKIALIQKNIIPAEICSDLTNYEKEQIKTKLGLNCYTINTKTTLITKVPETKIKTPEKIREIIGHKYPKLDSKSINSKEISLILTFYSTEMSFPGSKKRASIWEIPIRTEFVPKTMTEKDMVHYLEKIIDTIEHMEFPKVRPKAFVLQITDNDNIDDIKRIPLKLFGGQWKFKK